MFLAVSLGYSWYLCKTHLEATPDPTALTDKSGMVNTHWSTLLAMEAMMKRTASVTSQGGFPSFRVA